MLASGGSEASWLLEREKEMLEHEKEMLEREKKLLVAVSGAHVASGCLRKLASGLEALET